MQRRVLLGYPDGRVVPGHPGRHGHQTPARQRVVDRPLLVRRRQSGLVGDHPHLHQAHPLRPAARVQHVVGLGVHDAAPGAQPLHHTRDDHTAVAGGVLVGQAALEHPGDDFHVTVRVGRETGTLGHGELVERHQQPEVGVRGVVEVAERERVPRVEPFARAREPFGSPPDVDGRRE